MLALIMVDAGFGPPSLEASNRMPYPATGHHRRATLLAPTAPRAQPKKPQTQALMILLRVLIKQRPTGNSRIYIEISCFFDFLNKQCKMNEVEHAGGVRRGVASICDRSFDLISILGKVDFG